VDGKINLCVAPVRSRCREKCVEFKKPLNKYDARVVGNQA